MSVGLQMTGAPQRAEPGLSVAIGAEVISEMGASCRAVLPRANVLMVDDRPDKLLALEAILSPLGENLLVAHSGKEALRVLLNQEVAVILLDVSMPGMDGFETAALIRQRPKLEHTPIIFVTAVGDSDNHVSRGYSLGAVDYLLTPIVPEVLRTKVSVLVELYRKTELVKQQAEQLRFLNQELQQRVTELTHVNAELQAFNYSIAHDLRTPLRAMSGFAQALRDEESKLLTPSGKLYAERVARSAKFMDSLLLDLLAYSGVSRADMHFRPADLDAIVREVLGFLSEDVKQIGAEIEVVAPLGIVMAHATTLSQIVSNLISNSLKFTVPDRVPHIRIYAAPSQSFMLRLWVEDNGIGIRPEYQDKIFGLFQRLHDAQAYPGTGIGLAIVRKGVERMGGRAGVESEPGTGSRFWIELPIPNSQKSYDGQ